MMQRAVLTCAIAVAFTTFIAGQATPVRPAGDWPQWRGPDRTGLSKETGLLKQWPPSGPPVVWSAANLGAGYGSISVTGDRIFVQGSNGRQSAVTSLTRADGKGAWFKTLGAAGHNDQGPGPHGTPTVDDDRVYVLTEMGDLACLKVQDGAVVWQRPAGAHGREHGRLHSGQRLRRLACCAVALQLSLLGGGLPLREAVPD